MISEIKVQSHLCDQIFHGLKKPLRDSLRYLYDEQHAPKTQIMVAVGKAKSEKVDKGSDTVKAKAATVEGFKTMSSLREQISQLMAAIQGKKQEGQQEGKHRKNPQCSC